MDLIWSGFKSPSKKLTVFLPALKLMFGLTLLAEYVLTVPSSNVITNEVFDKAYNW